MNNGFSFAMFDYQSVYGIEPLSSHALTILPIEVH